LTKTSTTAATASAAHGFAGSAAAGSTLAVARRTIDASSPSSARWRLGLGAGTRVGLLPGPAAATFGLSIDRAFSPRARLVFGLGVAASGDERVPAAATSRLGGCGRLLAAWSWCAAGEAALLDVNGAAPTPIFGASLGLGRDLGGHFHLGITLGANLVRLRLRASDSAGEIAPYAYVSPPLQAGVALEWFWPGR
jgi:hypothetical protein